MPTHHQHNQGNDDDDDDDDMFGDDIALKELDLSAIVNANKQPDLTLGSDMFDDLDMDELNDLIQAEEARSSKQTPRVSCMDDTSIVQELISCVRRKRDENSFDI